MCGSTKQHDKNVTIFQYSDIMSNKFYFRSSLEAFIDAVRLPVSYTKYFYHSQFPVEFRVCQMEFLFLNVQSFLCQC